MATSQLLLSFLEQSGMPTCEWWNQAESAYHDFCQILTGDMSIAEHSNRSSRPMIVILPTANFACRLSSRNEILKCVAFGTVRSDLFVELVWQHIAGASNNGSKIKAYEVSERRILLDFSGFMFSLHYIESTELVKSYGIHFVA